MAPANRRIGCAHPFIYSMHNDHITRYSHHKSSLRLAVAQPIPHLEPHASRNVTDAAALVARAAGNGAEVVVFPEGYPGPLRAASEFDAAPALSSAARAGACAVCWSRVEQGADGLHRKVAYIHGPDGAQALKYVRTHPATGDVHPTLSGVCVAPGEHLACVEVAGVRIGLLICSELWLPEIARVLVVRGAEVLLAPAGGGFGKVAENWKLVARVRAIENECHLALTQNRFGAEVGAALIAGPESVLAEGSGQDLLVSDLDLERARWLRARDDSMETPKPFRAVPGLLRARRPELYGELSEPQDGLYDYTRAAAPEEVTP